MKNIKFQVLLIGYIIFGQCKLFGKVYHSFDLLMSYF